MRRLPSGFILVLLLAATFSSVAASGRITKMLPYFRSPWPVLLLTGGDYRHFGEVTAWRGTLRDGEQLVGEQKSFLW